MTEQPDSLDVFAALFRLCADLLKRDDSTAIRDRMRNYLKSGPLNQELWQEYRKAQSWAADLYNEANKIVQTYQFYLAVSDNLGKEEKVQSAIAEQVIDLFKVLIQGKPRLVLVDRLISNPNEDSGSGNLASLGSPDFGALLSGLKDRLQVLREQEPECVRAEIIRKVVVPMVSFLESLLLKIESQMRIIAPMVDERLTLSPVWLTYPQSHRPAGTTELSTDTSTPRPGTAEAPREAKGTDGFQDDELTSTMRDILNGAITLKAFALASCRSLPEITKAAGVGTPNCRSVRDAVKRLKDSFYLEAHRGQNGGHWITQKGRDIAAD